jgi:hypothetical protein
MIDAKAQYDIAVYDGETKLTEQTCIRDALFLADDLLNCSLKEKQRLVEVVSRKYPKVYLTSNVVLNTVQYYDLNNPKENLKFIKNLRKVLKLDGSWVELDYAARLYDGMHQTKG